MKPVFLTLIIVVYLGCENHDDLSMADRFMKQVETESYNEMFLPDLKPSDISILLKYRNNQKVLNKFPANPISSFICDSVTVGAVALSTIESIRLSKLFDAENEFNNFPSNPCLIDTSNQVKYRFAILDTVAILYYNWWINSNLTDIEKININPLFGTTYRWHY